MDDTPTPVPSRATRKITEKAVVFDLKFAWLEITGRCSLCCEHCYADSGPFGNHGVMTTLDWCHLIDEVVELGASSVQFIGGEPTLHPAFSELVEYALSRRLAVEVYTNLVHVSNRIWEIFGKAGVRLATSYYSDGGDEHDSITRRRGSYDRTKANIMEVVNRSIPLRVGLIDVRDGQRVEQARLELARLGVSDVTVDRLRRVGRGARDGEQDVAQLCGACAQGVVAISPTGEVWPCVFARWMPIGNVRQERLASILTGPAMRDAKARIVDGIETNERKKCRPESTWTPSALHPRNDVVRSALHLTGLDAIRRAVRTTCATLSVRRHAVRRAGRRVTAYRPATVRPTTKETRDITLFVRRAYIPADLLSTELCDSWPFTVSAVAELARRGLTFERSVTLLVGENGSGKSTIVEAIAEAAGLDAHGGRAGRKYGNARPKTALGEVLRLEKTARGARMAGGPRSKKKGYFLRAETAFGFMDAVSGLHGYWEDDTSEMSHGEGFLTVFNSMFREPGLYLMDEPDAALSFTSCLRLVSLIHELGRSGAQVICATHSPILAATPGAAVVEIGDHGVREVQWDDLDFVGRWRRLLDDPAEYLKHLVE